MARYELAESADADLAAIADYTIERFGIEQARRYRDSLLSAFESLAENPRLGRDAGHIRHDCVASSTAATRSSIGSKTTAC